MPFLVNGIRPVRLIVSSYQFQKFVHTVFHVFDLGTKVVRHDLHEWSRAALLVGGSVHQAQLSVSLETVVSSFPHDFSCSILHEHREVVQQIADCCSCGAVSITTVVDCPAAFSRAGWAGSSVSVKREVPVVNVFARCVLFWLSNSQVLGAFSTPTVPSFSQQCGFRHCRVHRSIRGLLTDFFHPYIEILELTSQKLDFLSGCHHSTPQNEDNRLV